MIVIVAIFLGIWSGIFINAMSLGMTNQRTENMLSTSVAHIQIHHPKYADEQNIKFKIDEVNSIEEFVATHQGSNLSARTKISGMVASANSSTGIQILGIQPESENNVSTIHQHLTEGTFLSQERKNSILISKKLSEKLKVKINQKVVLTFQDANYEIVSAAFRIEGLYKTPNARFDETHVLVKNNDINRILNTTQNIHEIAIWHSDKDSVDQLATALAAKFPEVKVETWKQLAPDLSYTDELMTQMLYIIMTIILMALAFGIVNTMLMAILERKRELGMLMAVGMNKTKVFLMVVIETIFLGLIAGPTSLLVSYFTVNYFKQFGLDLSMVSQGLEDVGYSPMVYFALDNSFYWVTLIMVIATALAASIYPAYKALKLNPVDSIRGI